jgi:hypothetical protein
MVKVRGCRFGSAMFFLLVGCASVDEPRVDLRGDDRVRFEADLKACQSYAAKVEETATATTSGAATGGAIGAAINVAVGGGVAVAAGTGAISAGIISGTSATQRKKQLIRKCLDERGYNLLD